MINGFWHGGNLTTMGRLSIASYLAHGHKYTLWTYGDVNNALEGTIIGNAEDIVPQSDMPKFRNVVEHSDWFRYHLILKNGGWWCDMDTVCMRPLPEDDTNIFCWEAPDLVGSAVFQAPKGSPVMQRCINTIKATDTLKVGWGILGPKFLTESVKYYKIEPKPTSLFYPIHWSKFRLFITPRYNPNFSSDTWVVHLWSELWRRNNCDLNAKYSDTCFYEEMKWRYLYKPCQLRPKSNESILISIISCDDRKYRRFLRAQKDTWIKDARNLGFDVEALNGKKLGVPDDYFSLNLKTKAMCKYALSKNYDYLLKVDNDTFLRPEKLMRPEEDYAGIRIHAHNIETVPNKKGREKYLKCGYKNLNYINDYASGGCYWLSRKAMQIIADAPFNDDDWSEDRWVGETLAKHNIFIHDMRGYIILWKIRFDKALFTDDLVVVTQVPSEKHLRDAYSYY